MAWKFNPISGNLDLVDEGGSLWLSPVADESSLPLTDPDGAVRVVLDQSVPYVFDATGTQWHRLMPVIVAPDASSTANGLSITEADTGDITNFSLKLHPADGTNPGIITTGTQTIAGNKTLTGNTKADGGIDVTATGGTDTLSIGTANADVINIGRSGATINIQGTTNYENVDQLQVTDPLITINKGGGAGSGANSGIEIEENALITGYAQTSADRNSWILKAPNTAGDATITPGVSGITLNQSSHDPVTLNNVGSSPNAQAASLSSQSLTLQPADGSNPGVITAGAQTIGGVKTFSSAPNLSSLTASTPLKLDGSKNIISADIDLTTDVTGVLPVANGGTNSNTALNNNRVIQSSSGAIVEAAAITANRALISDANGIPTHSSVTNTELGYVSGVTSAIQTQLNSKVPFIYETNTIFYNVANYANLQAAVDAAELLAGSDITNETGVTIILPDGDFSAQSVLIKKNVNFIGQGPKATIIGTITYRPTDATNSPQSVCLTNLQVNNLAAYNETVGGGVFDPNMLFTNGLILQNVDVYSSITFNRLNKVYFRSCFIEAGTVDMDLCEVVEYDNSTTISGNIDWTVNDAASNLPTLYGGGNLTLKNSFINAITLTKTGGVLEAYYQAKNSFINSVTRNGNTLINQTGGGVGTFSDSGSNNTFSDWYSHGPYTPADSNDWNTQPTFIDDAIDQLAAQHHETSFSIANNQAIAANVTGLAFANADIRAAFVKYSIFIDATSDLYEAGELELIQRGSDWMLSQETTGDNSLVVFDVDTNGQVTYTSSNYSGFVSGTMKFETQTTSV